MITGNALEYFSALARCCPPQAEVPEPPALCILLLTLRNSIKHCRSRIKLGRLMIKGTRTEPPQPRSGLDVEEYLLERNMQPETNKSPRTLAYEVNTSASKISPNFPSCVSAIPPILTRRRVAKNRYLPALDSR